MNSPKRAGPWSQSEIGAYLESAIIPARVSVVSESGWPIIVSLWFLYERETIFCAVRSTSRIAKHLAKQPRVGFEIAAEAPPYKGVRGQGLVSLSPDNDGILLTRLIDRYLGKEETPFRKWLLGGATEEFAVAIKPVRFMSWDYRGRMGS